MLRLADVDLLYPTRELCKKIESMIPVGDVLPWAAPEWPGPTLTLNQVAARRGRRMPDSFQVNQMWWPSGGDRWAFGVFLASGDQVERVRTEANGEDGQTSKPVTLEMAAEGQISGETLSLQVTVLKIVPLTQLLADPASDFEPNNLYLLVVVDNRFFWQHVPAPVWSPAVPAYGASRSVGDGGSGADVPTWASMFISVASALEVEINAAEEDIDDAYLKPDPSLNLTGAPIGPVLEALCRNCGLVLVAKYSGIYKAMTFDASKSLRDSDDASETGKLRTLRAGGDQFADEL